MSNNEAEVSRRRKVHGAERIKSMKPVKFLFLCYLALSLFGTKAVFAEGLSYKCLSSDEIVRSLAEEELCSDLDLTNKDKLSTCLQRKYMSAKQDLDAAYNHLVSDPAKSEATPAELKNESNIDSLLSFFRKKPVAVQGFVEQSQLDSLAQEKKRAELVKAQAAWEETLLYDCMDAARGVKNDPYPLLVIKGCLVGMTEERIVYLNGFL